MATPIGVVPDNKEDYNINNPQNNDPEFRIFVKGLDYSSIEIRSRKTDTIQTLKQRYQQITGKPVASQRLIFRGIELKDNEMLQYYAITGDSILHIAFKRLQNINNNNQNNNQNIYNQNNQRNIFGNVFGQNPNNPNNNNIMNDENLNLIAANPNNIGVDQSVFSILTCFTAYAIVCCVVPLIALPDIVTLIIVNDYDFNYSKDNITNECIWTYDGYVNISYFLNIGAAIAVLIYLVFALWLFWYLKVSNFIQANRVRPEELNLSGCHGVLASTKTMNLFWFILNFGLFCVAAYGIALYQNYLNSQCRTAEIGILLIVWSSIHLIFSFCICFPLCCSSLFCSSSNVFAHH